MNSGSTNSYKKWKKSSLKMKKLVYPCDKVLIKDLVWYLIFRCAYRLDIHDFFWKTGIFETFLWCECIKYHLYAIGKINHPNWVSPRRVVKLFFKRFDNCEVYLNQNLWLSWKIFLIISFKCFWI